MDRGTTSARVQEMREQQAAMLREMQPPRGVDTGAALRLECLRLAVRLRAGLGGVSHEDVLQVATDFERHVTGRED